MNVLAIITSIILGALTLFGAFVCAGAIYHAIASYRSQRRLDRDIRRFQRIQRQFNTKNTNDAEKN